MERLNIALRALCVVIMINGQCHGHGYLKDPPSRSSMWRYGFRTPINYDDNQLFCGGFDVQWNRNGGKCGICGDRWDGSRDNEAGGKYATGTISKHYRQSQTITVEVKLTKQHGGYFEFRICPNNSPSRRATQQCLDRFLLQQPDGSTKYYPIGGSQTYSLQLMLPRGLTCTQCVFQWIWNTASNWGCEAGKCGKGLGHQEQFRGCADVSITSEGSPSQNSFYTGNILNTGTQTNVHHTSSQTGHINVVLPVIHNNQQSNYQNSFFNHIPHGQSGSSIDICKATEQYKSQFPYADQFCVNQCKAGRCLSEYFCSAACKSLNLFSNSQHLCEATPQFKATNPYATQYCISFCTSGHCPAHYCTGACHKAA